MGREDRREDDHQHRGRNAFHPAPIELEQRESPIPHLVEYVQRDQVAGDDEEYVHPDEAAGEPRPVDVKDDDREHGDSPQAIDIRPITARRGHGNCSC